MYRIVERGTRHGDSDGGDGSRGGDPITLASVPPSSSFPLQSFATVATPNGGYYSGCLEDF